MALNIEIKGFKVGFNRTQGSNYRIDSIRKKKLTYYKLAYNCIGEPRPTKAKLRKTRNKKYSCKILSIVISLKFNN